MISKGILLFLIITVASLYAQVKIPPGNSQYLQLYRQYDKLYEDAAKLSQQADYNEKTEEKELGLNRRALEGFRGILDEIEDQGDDSLAFHCNFRIGTLEHYFDSLEAARHSYSKAITLKSRLPQLQDSFLFRPYLFTGSILYSLNQFDSALYYYKKAEAVATNYDRPLLDANRLYNTLGALYYETGNYRQANNYFEKAIAILQPGDPSYEALLVNYKINQASTLNKLDEFNKAYSIYRQILPLNINRNEILHNTGTVNLNLDSFSEAVSYFKKVRYNSSRNVRLFNDLGYAYLKLGMQDSALAYFALAIEENKKWNGEGKNPAHGLTLKYLGDELSDRGQYQQALEKYQAAIIQLDNDFKDHDIYVNPSSYSGIFSYINLFHTLTAKALAFEKLYLQRKDLKNLLASLDAYRSSYKLADYVERTYDSDEARLFLNKIKHTVHSKPIDISLLLYDLTGKKEYLEDAYLFDQQTKASVLAFNVREDEIRKTGGEYEEIFRNESVIKSEITRLSLKAAQTTDSVQLDQLRTSIRELEIRLGKLREKIYSDPAWQQKRSVQQIPPVKELQKMLDKTTALLSFHLSETELITLIITSKQFGYRRSPATPDFYKKIDSFKLSLYNTASETAYEGTGVSMDLYRQLIEPLQSELVSISRLIIIPDDELHYLPFEALQDRDKKFLLGKFAVQYQFSTALLGKPVRSVYPTGILSFAPFTSKSHSDTAGNNFSILPASREEVNELKGRTFLDSSATKSNFLLYANGHGILHLATHAIVDNENPLRSFIAFFPGHPDHKLFAQEIYDLDLDSVELVILSACETGTGQLVKGEGLMSLSRAFAYAGCSNIITSLWKAEDRTTAFITKKLHQYLDNGSSSDKALQQAKLDLLNSNEISPRLKSPNYWAHLVYIGQYEPGKKKVPWVWIIVSTVFILVIVGIVYIRRQSSFVSHKS